MSVSEAVVLWCRASRPFSRTPVKLPLAADSNNEVPSSSAPQQEPAPLAWTPMRAQAMTPQTGGLRGFGLKRMREGEGTPGTPGTPLLQAGQASEAVRRIRQRSDKVCSHLRKLYSRELAGLQIAFDCASSFPLPHPHLLQSPISDHLGTCASPGTAITYPSLHLRHAFKYLQPSHDAACVFEHTIAVQAVGSAERRVWRAGATPFPRRLGSAEQSPGNAAPAPSRLGVPSRGPVPMTESARRIAEALDSMAKVGHSLTVSLLCTISRMLCTRGMWHCDCVATENNMSAPHTCLYMVLQM